MDLLDLIEAQAVTRPVDAERAELLETVATDRVHATDREMVVAAILADADMHGGLVDPNRVRQALTRTSLETGKSFLTVNPRVLSAVYSSLSHRGAITATGVTTNLDRGGGNHGKPLRTYTLTDREAAA